MKTFLKLWAATFVALSLLFTLFFVILSGPSWVSGSLITLLFSGVIAMGVYYG